MHSYDDTMKHQIFIFPDDFPMIVCICGSSRFCREWQMAIWQETYAGNITLQLGTVSQSDDQLLAEGMLVTGDKERLEQLHLRKIDLAHEVLILNVDGYLGQSTLREWMYAIDEGKEIRWWDKERGYEEEQAVASLGRIQAGVHAKADHLVRRYFEARLAGKDLYTAYGEVLHWFGQTSLDEQIQIIQQQLAPYLPKDHSLADELIAERREESTHE